MMLPSPMQGSLPAGWLAFAGREFNPLDHDKRFQFVSSSSSGFILAQGKFHEALCLDLSQNASYGISAVVTYSGLMLAAWITLAHFSVSSTMNLPKSEGEPGNAILP